MNKSFIPLSVPQLGGNEWKYLKECLDSGWVSSAGPFVNRFEQEFTSKTGASYAVAVVNGTSALHIALRVIGVQSGDEVIVPNLTFIAPANAVFYLGAHPVLMDIDPETWQIDPKKIALFLKTECEIKKGECFNKMTGRRIRALVAVHLLGLSCDLDPLLQLCRDFHLKLVEDAAEAMGVRYRGRHVGTLGHASAFSFNGNKVVTAGGGGMVVFAKKEEAEEARYLTTQAKDDPLEYIHNQIGYNYRLTNIQAALGLAQLEQLDLFLHKKKEIAQFYQEALKGIRGLTLMPTPSFCEPTYWLYTVLLDQETSLSRRQQIVKELNEKGIGARPFWHTLHDLPPFAGVQAYQVEHSKNIYCRGICLPSSTGLTSDDLSRVVEIFKKIVS